MASSYSSNLKLELIGTGDQSGTWGNTTNTNLGVLLEQAIVGYTTQAITDGADTVLTIANGTSSVARNYVLQLTGALTANRNLIVPAIQKSYIIFNSTTGGFSVTVKVSGQPGVTVANGRKAIVYNNGTDIIEVVNAAVTENGTQTLTNKTLSTGTAITAGTINNTSVGATTPSTGAFTTLSATSTSGGAGSFTTLSASSTVSGAGFSTYLASPPAIGGTTPAAGTFTTLNGTTITASTQFSGPHNGTVGATTPNTGAFTTLSASSTVSGAGFSTYLASPPAIGGTAPAAGSFTTLAANADVTFSGTGATKVQVGTTAQRPTAAQGMVRYNTTLSTFETYNGTAWTTIGASDISTQTIWVPAASMIARTTSPPAAGLSETTTNKVMLKTYDFDPATAQYVQFNVRMPKGWNEGTVTAAFVWSTTGTTGNVVWGIQGAAMSSGDSLDTAFGTAQTLISAVPGASLMVQTTSTAAVTIGGTAAELDWVVFQVYRNAANASDTLTANASLLGVVLLYVTASLNDA